MYLIRILAVFALPFKNVLTEIYLRYDKFMDG